MKWVMIQLVILYRVTLGRLLGGQCRFEPSCSQYAIDALNKYGAFRGGWRAMKRIARRGWWQLSSTGRRLQAQHQHSRKTQSTKHAVIV